MTATPTPADVPGLGEPVAWQKQDNGLYPCCAEHDEQPCPQAADGGHEVPCEDGMCARGYRNGYERGRDEERAAVVAWLSGKRGLGSTAALIAASEVKRGEHRDPA